MRITLCCVRLLSLCIIFALCTGCNPVEKMTLSGKTIRIGVIGPMGYAAGDKCLKGIKTAQIIEPYTQNGDQIEFSVFDDKLQPSEAAKIYKELAEKGEFKAVIMLSTSSVMLAVTHLADQYKLPIIGTIATHPEITQNSQYVGRICFNDDRQGKVAAIYVRDELFIERVAIIFDDQSAYSRNLKNVFRQSFRAVGGKVAAVLPIDQLQKNKLLMLSELRELDVQLLYMVVDANRIIEILEVLEVIDWPVKKMAADGTLSVVSFMAKENVDMLDGLFATDHISTNLHLSEIGELGRQTYLEHFGEPDAYNALGFEAYLLLMHALNRCNPELSSECMAEHIRNVSVFNGIFGPFPIKDGESWRPVMVNEIQDGRLQLRVKVY